jgi:phosphoglycolate phosphatase
MGSKRRGGRIADVTYDLVIFDFDGTLADSAEWFFDALDDAAEAFGFSKVTPAAVEQLHAFGMKEMLRALEVPLHRLPAIEEHMRRRGAENIDALRLFKSIPEALARLRLRGARLAVVSSNAESIVRTVLGQTLAGYMHGYGCSAPAFGKEAKLLETIARAGVEVSRAIYVGDEVRDIEAAKAVGMASAAVAWGFMASSALRRLEPSMIIDHVAAIAEL